MKSPGAADRWGGRGIGAWRVAPVRDRIHGAPNTPVLRASAGKRQARADSRTVLL